MAQGARIMTTGFVIGKFYPPHRGHKLLIDTAQAQCDRLIVMICHHESQTIPGDVRKAWLEEIHPRAEVHLVPDIVPDESEPWAAFVKTHLGFSPDLVFSSEVYGEQFASLLDARHVMVDQARKQVPISGSIIRAAPLEHLHFLEPCVRAWFVKRVVLIGAESTGKTTLAKALALAFETNWVAEYGREHWEEKIQTQTARGEALSWTPDEFEFIAAEQQRREDEAARIANRILICDTNAFATATWFERYEGHRSEAVDAKGASVKADLYLVPAVDVPFVQDGVRDGEKIRDWMHDRFVTLLSDGSAPFEIIRGPYDSRLPKALAAIERHLGLKPQQPLPTLSDDAE